MTTTANTYSDGSARDPFLERLTDRELTIVLARHGGPALESARLEAELRALTCPICGDRGLLDDIPCPRQCAASTPYHGSAFKASDLRIVSNNSRDWQGGYTVETRDGTIQAGPFASKDDAKAAKRDLVETGITNRRA